MGIFARFVVLALICGPAVIFPLQSQADTTQWKNVGNWNVSFYSKLPGCLAYMSFEGGTSFWIGFIKRDNNLLLDVTLMDDEWKSIEESKEYSVKVYFGDETPWTLEMSGRNFDGSPGLTFAFDAFSDQAAQFAEEFMREVDMKWFYRNVELGYYSLRGSREAFREAAACQKSFNDALEGVSDPFGGPSDGATSDPFAQ